MFNFSNYTFVEADEMKSIAISAFESELLVQYWLGLVNAHNHERVDLDTHSSSALRQDHYALERCEAFIAAGLLSQSDFEAIRHSIFDKEGSDMPTDKRGWARIRSDQDE